MSTLELKPATRQGVKPLIGLYSESGCGKTMSALLLARGFVGPSGKIAMIDTESGRGSMYADVIPGGYDTLQLVAPFSPERYIEAVQTVEKSGATIGIIDSASHEWEGLDGVLDMAMKREEKSGKPGLHNWREPKMHHARFMLKLLQSSIPWIICLRAKHKTRQVKNQGKTEIVKEDFTTPIQADDFIFEMSVHGEIMQDHTFRLTKCSHPELRRCMPNNELTTVEHGKLLAQWCAAPGGPGIKPVENLSSLKRQLWDLTRDIHQCPKGEKDKATQKDGVQKLNQWMWDENVISDTEAWETLTAERLPKVIETATEKLEAEVVP